MLENMFRSSLKLMYCDTKPSVDVYHQFEANRDILQLQPDMNIQRKVSIILYISI